MAAATAGGRYSQRGKPLVLAGCFSVAVAVAVEDMQTGPNEVSVVDHTRVEHTRTTAATLPPSPTYQPPPLAHRPVGNTELRVAWTTSALLVTPGIALLTGGVALGWHSPLGVVLIISAALYLAVEAIWVQPRIAFHLPGLELERVALDFAHHRIHSRTHEELAHNLQRALGDGLGVDEAILVLQGMEGQLTFGGDAQDHAAIRTAPQALSFLKRQAGPSTRDQLARLTADERAVAALKLLDELEADIFLSFVQDDQLLGFAVFDFPWKNSEYAEAFLDVISESMTSGLINQHLRKQAGGHEVMSQVFALAQAMQNSLLPSSALVQIEAGQLQGWSEPADQCGGDLWAWHELGDGKTLLFVGDATGHGVSPATLAAAVSGSLAAHACTQRGTLQPGTLLADLNALVRKVGRSHHMMTAFAAVVDAYSFEIHYANAGHNPPLLWRADDEAGLTPLKVAGSMLGSADELVFLQGSQQLNDDDMLFLFTDGIVEAGEPEMPRLGNREFRKTLVECANRTVGVACDHMRERVLRHLGDNRAGDDMTFLALRFSQEFEDTK